MYDEDKEPLLDEFGGHRRSESEGRWKLPFLPQLPRWALRAPLLIGIGGIFFLLGWLVQFGSPLKRRLDPDLSLAIRVRVLNSLIQERYPVTDSQHARHENYEALDRLSNCLEAGTCGPGERTVILLASYHFGQAEVGGTGGEDVWARSTIASFRQLNYTMLMTWGHMDALFIYQSIPELIPIVLWEEGELKHCSMRNETNYAELEKLENNAMGTWQTGTKACMQSEAYPQGIPWWKSFVFLFWDFQPNPLGQEWTLSPEDYDLFSDAPRNHTYLGYSIEKKCQAVPFHTRREHRAMILAKDNRYLDAEASLFHGLLDQAAKSLPPQAIPGGEEEFSLLCTAGDGSEVPEPGIKSIGVQPQKEWHDLLAKSKVLLGLGQPVISPSPYYALCLGVPFINPIHSRNDAEPNNRRYWHTQQDALKFMEPPYVYHVFRNDMEGLKEALHKAAYTPIRRYILPKMRASVVTERHRKLAEHDWLGEAKRKVAEMGEEHAYLAMEATSIKGTPH